MSFLDSAVIQLKSMINGPAEVVDQSALYYKVRSPGPDYMPPFSIANISKCPGFSTPIPGEEPIDFWVTLFNEVGSYTDEMVKDRSEFFGYDFASYGLQGEVLADPLFQPKDVRMIKYKY